jgi:RNA polymerase sigma-70 factor, ECF subfamily
VSSAELPSPRGSPLDPSVVAALYLEHAEELRRFLMGILRDSQLTADVLQTTFVKLVQRGHETRVESRKAWLFRVAYNEAMVCRRRQGVGDKVLRRVAWNSNSGGSQVDEGNTEQGSVEEPLLRWEAVQSVRQALEQLSPEQRQVVRMRIYEEKTFATIAQELNIPLGTALGRMRGALAKLRSQLSHSDEHESEQ